MRTRIRAPQHAPRSCICLTLGCHPEVGGATSVIRHSPTEEAEADRRTCISDPKRRHVRSEAEENARRVISAAEKKANGRPAMNIAVADEGGNIVAHVRMDGAWIGSIDISMKKAYTSRAFDIATKDLATHSPVGGQFFGIHASNDGKDHDIRRRHSAEEGRRQSRRRSALAAARATRIMRWPRRARRRFRFWR